MKKTVVINIVGLSKNRIGEHTPFLSSLLKTQNFSLIEPMVPAVTCSVQATYLTGKMPSDHGIVGNGWFDTDEQEVKFWKQSNHLVHGYKIWDAAKAEDPSFTCANYFWWYNMYSSVDVSITPRPQYRANGLKIPDIYTVPATWRDEVQKKLGQFPLFKFWGPATSIEASRWIAQSAIASDQKFDPTLSLIYLPHLDYNLQRYGDDPSISQDLQDIDKIGQELAEYYQKKGAEVIWLSEYGIQPVQKVVYLNRIFREKGWLAIREENGKELLDAGASKVFAVVDHQVAHVYLQDKSIESEVLACLEAIPEIAHIWDKVEQRNTDLAHERSGHWMVLAQDNAWFAYYYWLNDAKAADFARTVEIHKKPGYDPVEMLADPKIKFLKPLIIWKLIKKKLGFRTLMDVIPLDASLIKGSHGVVPMNKDYWPILISSETNEEEIKAKDVYGVIWKVLNRA